MTTTIMGCWDNNHWVIVNREINEIRKFVMNENQNSSTIRIFFSIIFSIIATSSRVSRNKFHLKFNLSSKTVECFIFSNFIFPTQYDAG